MIIASSLARKALIFKIRIHVCITHTGTIQFTLIFEER